MEVGYRNDSHGYYLRVLALKTTVRFTPKILTMEDATNWVVSRNAGYGGAKEETWRGLDLALNALCCLCSCR